MYKVPPIYCKYSVEITYNLHKITKNRTSDIPVLGQPIIYSCHFIMPITHQSDGMILIGAAGVQIKDTVGVKHKVRVRPTYTCNHDYYESKLMRR